MDGFRLYLFLISFLQLVNKKQRVSKQVWVGNVSWYQISSIFQVSCDLTVHLKIFEFVTFCERLQQSLYFFLKCIYHTTGSFKIKWIKKIEKQTVTSPRTPKYAFSIIDTNYILKSRWLIKKKVHGHMSTALMQRQSKILGLYTKAFIFPNAFSFCSILQAWKP